MDGIIYPLSELLLSSLHVFVGADHISVKFLVKVILGWVRWLLDGFWVELPDMVKLLLGNVERVPGGENLTSISSEVWNEVVDWVSKFFLLLWVKVLCASS